MKKAKILVSTTLALCMGATAVIPAFAAENQKFTYTKIGDYNADNAVDISDVTALQLQLVGKEVKEVITGAMLEHLDFNGDGSFNVKDVSEIQKMIVGTDYECYLKTDSSYKDIVQTGHTYPGYGDVEGTGIKSEIICETADYIMTVDEMKRNPVKGCALITSKEQFCDIFKAESPEFDEEFFKDNALFAMLSVNDKYDSVGVYSFAVDGNKLIVFDYKMDTFEEYGEDCCENNIYRLNKADIENITEIEYYTTHMAQ